MAQRALEVCEPEGSNSLGSHRLGAPGLLCCVLHARDVGGLQKLPRRANSWIYKMKEFPQYPFLIHQAWLQSLPKAV